MKLIIVSAAIESVYYNGRVKSAKKLDREDFTQLTKAALGTFMRNVYREEEGYASIFSYFGNCLSELDFEVTEDNHHREIVSLDPPVVKLPHGAGVFSVKPIDGENNIINDSSYTKLEAGSDWLYTDEDLDDTGTQTYKIQGNLIFLRNSFEKTKKVAIEGLFLDDDFDVPEDVAFSVMNAIFTRVLPLEGFPIDKTDDQNPNLIEYKRRLSSAQDQL